MKMKAERILVMKLSSLGDIIHALPAVTTLRQRFPEARLTWMVKERWAPILEGNPDIDEIFPLKDSWKNWPGTVRTLRSGRFDLVVDFQGLFRSGLLGAVTGAPIRVGFARAREGATWFYTHHVPLSEDKPCSWRLLDIHAVDRNLAVTEFLGGVPSTPVFHLPQFSVDGVAIDNLLQDAGVQAHEHLIALAPWTRSAIKAWPQHCFWELSERLLQQPDRRVVLIGGTSEISSAETFKVLTSRGLINLVGKVSLRQLPLLLQKVQLLIGNDSAALHVAAGVRTPVLAIFGPTHPMATGPYPLERHMVVRENLTCSPCGSRRCRNPHYLECLQSISVDRLLGEVERMLPGLSSLKEEKKAF